VGQKVHPYGLRLGIIKTWKSRWFADKRQFGKNLTEDIKIRSYIKKNFGRAGISNIEIEKTPEKIKIIIHTARPGIVIGRRGSDIDRLKEDLQVVTGKEEIYIDVKEVKDPWTDAQLVAENVAFQLTKRVSYRRAMKKAVYNAMNSKAEGIRIICSGRLGGAEMSRRAAYKEGKIPLHTLRADIDYGFAEARTTYGTIGVKVWIYKGEVLPEVKEEKK
jgi:small subunit ribosomal protein S3